MRYRKLGNTGIFVSEIGFGAWGIGGLTEGATSYGATDDETSKKALKKAYSLGINFFDTSNVYGNGHSEELIGEVFKKIRSKVIIASKVGFSRHLGPQDFSRDYTLKSLEKSLKRLDTDYLDLLQLHSPSLDALEETDILETLQKLKGEGSIRAYGISARSPADAVSAVRNYPFDSVQVNFNLTDQRAIETGLFGICEDKKIGVIARTPLCFGFLSGEYQETKFDSSDHRSAWSKEQREVWATAYSLFQDTVRKDREQTNAQVALRFCLSYGQVSSVIPGMLNSKEVCENAFASQLGPLHEEEIQGIERIFKENAFFIKENK